MDPSQLQTFFERATNSSLRLTKESLEKIVNDVDGDGDGLVSVASNPYCTPEHLRHTRKRALTVSLTLTPVAAPHLFPHHPKRTFYPCPDV